MTGSAALSRFTEAFNCDEMRQSSHLFFERDETGGEAVTNGIPVAAMVLDWSGTVCCCHADAARLFRASPNTLVGRHVRELIPDLPFESWTPGYNIAHAASWAREGPRRGFHGVDSQGRSFGLQVALDRLELEKRHEIWLRLRPAVESSELPGQHAASGIGVEARANRTAISVFAE